MTDKPIGPAAAARELWEPLKKVFQAANLTPDPNMETNIEAIILKHCPEEKAAPELLEIAAKALEWWHIDNSNFEKQEPEFIQLAHKSEIARQAAIAKVEPPTTTTPKPEEQ